jgi:hypothetical protein
VNRVRSREPEADGLGTRVNLAESNRKKCLLEQE